MPVLDVLNARAILIKAVDDMKFGKAPGLDGCPVWCVKKPGMTMLELLMRLFNVSFDMGTVPVDWHGSCKVPMYKGKSDNRNLVTREVFVLLSVVGKLYGRVQIKRVMDGTEFPIGEEQCGFNQGRGCMDQVFSERQVFKKYLVNAKVVFLAFMDLEKVYNMIDLHGMWQMPRVYGVEENCSKQCRVFMEIAEHQ